MKLGKHIHRPLNHWQQQKKYTNDAFIVCLFDLILTESAANVCVCIWFRIGSERTVCVTEFVYMNSFFFRCPKWKKQTIYSVKSTNRTINAAHKTAESHFYRCWLNYTNADSLQNAKKKYIYYRKPARERCVNLRVVDFWDSLTELTLECHGNVHIWYWNERPMETSCHFRNEFTFNDIKTPLACLSIYDRESMHQIIVVIF